ncbi:HNH endonuclease [Mesorhizobium sp. WSM4303]|uniref:HNH endonuclease n=1 Tax=Mesorhizobium sp. WSM4303 TaxID=2589887 RepID=UPI00115E1354|nr:HNH endonuclease signature motif containing protein [Mesorhizobium sp. WSM4303]TRD03829.1 HNH endonuclease [Mesorhizobium sp. WSM4303]
MARSVSEWRGKTDNHMPPATVRQRILERANFKCHVCCGEIDKPGWHADHIPPLKDGGENRESKIQPAHEVCHRKLTAQQAVDRAPTERQKMKHSGAARPAGKIPTRAKEPPVARKQSLQPRQLFRSSTP